MLLPLALPITLMATACTPTERIPEAGAGRACKAEAAASLIGRKMSDETGQKACALAGAGMVRWVRPGQAVTMDYRTDRLNIMLDEKDRITRFTCG